MFTGLDLHQMSLSLHCSSSSAVYGPEFTNEVWYTVFNLPKALNLVCSACGKPCRSKTESDLHTKRTGHTEFVDKTLEAAKSISLEVPKMKVKAQELRERARKKKEMKANKKNERKHRTSDSSQTEEGIDTSDSSRTEEDIGTSDSNRTERFIVLSESESVNWLNHATEKIWPICMEQIASQKILLPIIPWFLEKYKPWTAKKVVVQHLYLGRNAPLITEMRVLHQWSDDDDLVLELGLNFLTAEDMSAVLAVKLRKRLGFGMWAKLHITRMHVEAKVLIGMKFVQQWPFLGRLRLCFVEPPYFQMTVKPIFTHGLDVTEVPGIAKWLDKLLSLAFEETLVEPNTCFCLCTPGNWFSVHEKQPPAQVKVEVIEAADMKPSDLNGLADPYVKGQVGSYRFKTKTHKKTLSPKWHEEFMIPIFSWDTPNVLTLEVLDKDHFVDDFLGKCTVNIGDYRGGQRHEIWLPLQNTKMGRAHIAITALEDNTKGSNGAVDVEALSKEDSFKSLPAKASNKGSSSPISSSKSVNLPDHFEPINIEGQQETGIWFHCPGSEVLQTWEPRKGKARSIETEIHGVSNDSLGINLSAGSLSPKSDHSSSPDAKRNRVKHGLQKKRVVFYRRKSDRQSGSLEEVFQFPDVNLKAVDDKEVLEKLIPDENLLGHSTDKISNEGSLSTTESSSESPSKIRCMASFLKRAEKSARRIKCVLSNKGRKSRESSIFNEDFVIGLESSADEYESSLGVKE
ncbi:C2 domain-containing protein [Hibiscus syriacus]|uniref:C2 domain-containing protein n=1 Tax=Hibiscus syriacus TaxID=106335 RepID=A0A6A2WKX3_HIBSY|nr:C2 domain-containing protein [Hibiscus syriacus]